MTESVKTSLARATPQNGPARVIEKSAAWSEVLVGAIAQCTGTPAAISRVTRP